MNRQSWRIVFSFALAFISRTASADEPINFRSKLIKGLDLNFYGTVENDLIYNSVESLTDGQNSSSPPRRVLANGQPNYAGQHGRLVMSARNSRFGFKFALPKSDDWGIQTKGVLEIDFLGNQAADAPPDTAVPTSNAERDYFMSPSLRIRLAYVDLTRGEWTVKFGQDWSLLGWKPYYYNAETFVQNGPAQFFRRYPQNRFTNAHSFGDQWLLESAALYAKPPEIDSSIPLLQGGLRLSSKTDVAGVKSAMYTYMIGLSAAVTAESINLRTALGPASGGAIAVDLSVPIIPSSDGKSMSNNLIWFGEYVNGSGIGGLEVPGLSGGVNAVNVGKTNTAGTTLDSGMAGINGGGRIELIRFRHFRSDFQYHFPGEKWAVAAGYAQVEGRNLDRFTLTAGQDAGAIIPKTQEGYFNIYYDPLKWLRFAAEYNQTVSTYNDPANRQAINNHWQFSTNFIF